MTWDLAEAIGSMAPCRKHEQDHTEMLRQFLTVSSCRVDRCSSSPDRSSQQKQNVLLRGQNLNVNEAHLYFICCRGITKRTRHFLKSGEEFHVWAFLWLTTGVKSTDCFRNWHKTSLSGGNKEGAACGFLRARMETSEIQLWFCGCRHSCCGILFLAM